MKVIGEKISKVCVLSNSSVYQIAQLGLNHSVLLDKLNSKFTEAFC